MTDLLKVGMAWQSIADALGDPFEFEHDIKIADVLKAIHSEAPLSVTDDSQMAYFSMRALEEQLSKSPKTFPQIVRAAYLEWYSTQIGQAKNHPHIPVELFKRRAPGNTCMTALGYIRETGDSLPNRGRGCGSVMRILPFNTGILPPRLALKCSLDSAVVTHHHPDNVNAVKAYCAYAQACIENRGTTNVPERVKRATSIGQLGAGFYADEAVNMAIWANYYAHSYEEMLTFSIGHDGDSDSVGAIAAGLWGLRTKTMPPQSLLSRVIEWPVLEKQVDSLLAVAAQARGNQLPAKDS